MQLFCFKLHEKVITFAMVGFVRDMTARKSCKCGEYGSLKRSSFSFFFFLVCLCIVCVILLRFVLKGPFDEFLFYFLVHSLQNVDIEASR